MRPDDVTPGTLRSGARVRVFPPTLPADAKPGGTRGRILESALVAFAERGFHGTSIRAIAEGVGINSATLYSHFASKAEILAALVAIGSTTLLARVKDGLAQAATSGERLDAIMRATAVAHATYPLLAIVTNSEFYALPADLAGTSRAPTTEAASLLRWVIAEGTADGSFTLADPPMTAHVLEGMAQQIPMWMDPVGDDPESLAIAAVAIARRIVGARAESHHARQPAQRPGRR